MAAKKNTTKETNAEVNAEAVIAVEERSYTKAALLKCSEFKRDLISTLLSDEARYTKSQVREMINRFMKGGVC